MTKTDSPFSVKVPGSIMLFGEHSVLYGGVAIVAAIDQYMYVELIPRADKNITINSNRLGCYQTSLQALTAEKPFDYVLTAILQFYDRLTQGFDLVIRSEFAENLGLGSSAAVSVAVVKVLAKWLELPLNLKDLFLKSRIVIQTVQGIGSGADVAASVYGGTIAYCATPLEINPVLSPPEIALIYSGYKTPTKIVIEKVSQKQAQNPEVYSKIYTAMNACTQDAITACCEQNWNQVGELMNIYQGLQEAIGVSTSTMSSLIYALRQQPKILGAKISGSGLGDCIWGLGFLPANVFPQNDFERQKGVCQLDIKIENNNNHSIVGNSIYG